MTRMDHLDCEPHRPLSWPPPAVPAARPQLVIADDGTDAELIVLRWPLRLAVGDRFEHRGRWWTVTACRTAGRSLVATPEGH